jgi:predicted dehydrogenase
MCAREIIGVGSHSCLTILPTLHYLPVRVVALCELDPSLLERTATGSCVDALQTDAESMHAEEQLAAVLICADPQLHPALAILAFSAGLYVYMQKPPAKPSRGDLAQPGAVIRYS